jgi:hypothetical protein
MKGVWNEVYREKRGARGEFFNPARLTNRSKAVAIHKKAQELRKKAGEKDLEDAKFLDFEATLIERLPEVQVLREWSEQDCAAQQLLARAYRIALDCQPEKLSDIQSKSDKLRNISGRLRELARELESIGQYVYPYYADKIEVVADHCEDHAKVITPNLVNSPWLIIRDTETDPRLRTIVVKLAYCTHHLFLKILPTTIAHLANVIQDSEPDSLQRKNLTRDMVRTMLGEKHLLTIHPTFGPLIYPMFEARDRKVLRSLSNNQPRRVV